MSVAIVGRPNVGKSTLFNRLAGAERSIVHDMPGTTRDAIDTVIDTDEGPLRIVDTAGMRRKSRIDEGSEYFSLVRSLAAIDRADVAIMLIDATEGITNQDQRLAERVDAGGCAIVIVLNKWELLNAEQRARDHGRRQDQAAVPRLRADAEDQREVGPRGAQADAGAARRHRGVPPARADPRAQPGDPGCSGGSPGAGRADPVRHPRRRRPTHVHALHESQRAGAVSALPRAQDPRALRFRRHAAQAPGAPTGGMMG